MNDGFFKKALNSFAMGAACDEAIRHLTDRGYTPTRIRDSLTFPAPMERICAVMWERLIETHMILLSDPRKTALDDQTEIIERRDEYGRKSFISVKKESPGERSYSPEDYILFDRSLRPSDDPDEFIAYLPWPAHPLWVHVSLFQGQESSS